MDSDLPSSDAIAGIVVAAVLALFFLVVATILLFLVTMKRKTSWFKGVKAVLDVSTHHTIITAILFSGGISTA